MSLELRIQQELKDAMLAKNEAALRALRAIKAAILLEKTSGRSTDLSPEEEIKLLQKLVKQRKESAAIYRSQQREDLARSEEEEITVIEKFLPEQMDEEQLTGILKNIIEQTGASGPGALGKVMAVATKELAGKADNKLIAAIAKKLLG
jgi:uncharacterized protein YqeY